VRALRQSSGDVSRELQDRIDEARLLAGTLGARNAAARRFP
jgi:hypothetical protein